MSSKRVFFLMLAVVAILASLFVGSVILGNNQFQEQSTRLVELKLEDALIEEQRAALNQAKKDVEELAELNAVAQSIVPKDKDQARTVREITKIAADNNIPLDQIQFPSSSLGQTVQRSGGSSSTSTTAPPITQAQPVKDIKGVYSMEVIVQQDAERPRSFSNIIAFLSDLEKNRRTAHVKRINLRPVNEGGGLTVVLNLEVYIKP